MLHQIKLVLDKVIPWCPSVNTSLLLLFTSDIKIGGCVSRVRCSSRRLKRKERKKLVCASKHCHDRAIAFFFHFLATELLLRFIIFYISQIYTHWSELIADKDSKNWGKELSDREAWYRPKSRANSACHQPAWTAWARSPCHRWSTAATCRSRPLSPCRNQSCPRSSLASQTRSCRQSGTLPRWNYPRSPATRPRSNRWWRRTSSRGTDLVTPARWLGHRAPRPGRLLLVSTFGRLAGCLWLEPLLDVCVPDILDLVVRGIDQHISCLPQPFGSNLPWSASSSGML